MHHPVPSVHPRTRDRARSLPVSVETASRKTANVTQVVRDGTERLKTIPGVIDASAGCCLPLRGGFGVPFDIVGRPKGNAPSTGGGGYYSVSPDYFDTFKNEKFKNSD